MNEGNNVETRRARLRAMRERYEQNAGSISAGSGGKAVLENDNESAQLPVPVRKRASGPAMNGSPKQAAGGLVQRVATFLTQPGAGARFVSGTNIREDRLGQLVQFLKRRGAAASGQQAQRAQNILAYLTEAAPGERMVANVNIARAQSLIERVGDKQPRSKGATAAAGGQEQPIEGDVLVAKARETNRDIDGKSGKRLGEARASATETVAVAENLPALVERARRLSEELLSVQRRICQLVAGSGVVESSAVAEKESADLPPSPARSQETRGEWFMDFLE